jgi:predicted ABC-class ATPase
MQLKAQHESRISHLEKENTALLAEKQQEKERMMKDVDTLNQRLNQLQRQLDKQQVIREYDLLEDYCQLRCDIM